MKTYIFFWHSEYNLWEMRFSDGSHIFAQTKNECYEKWMKHKG